MQRRSKRRSGPDEPDGPAADGELDRRVRSSLDPPPGAAARIARGALDPEASSGRPAASGWRLAVAGLVVAAVALSVVLALSRPWRPSSPPAGVRAAATAADPGPRYRITNRGAVVVVRSIDGGSSALHSTSGRRSSPPGMRLIVYGGPRT